MLFSSNIFIFGFLPIALLLFYAAARFGRTSAMATLALLSLGFYAYWKPEHLWVLLFSIGYNFVLGRLIQNDRAAGRMGRMRAWLWLGLGVDLGLLLYFKYTMFIVANVNAAVGTSWDVGHILLPLGISFFTFQKIAYLVDSARGDAKRTGLIEFSLFAAFFPQLIAGPIVHYTEVIPQFHRRLFGSLLMRNIMIGLAIFAIGLFKKTVIADSIANYLNPMYDFAAHHPGSTDFRTGWLMAISFTLQVYFDFSGYSDMAIGLARMFGILLPLNFHSPLRAASIIDYWRRWHMTLQRFVVTYVFQPLSIPLNRFVAQRGMSDWSAFAVGIAIPSFITFVVIGIWHGAGWTFVLFGMIHATYICINEAWRERRKRRRKALRRLKQTLPDPGLAERLTYHAITLFAVVVANMLFRAETLPQGVDIIGAMLGARGFAATGGAVDPILLGLLVAGAAVVALMPNTQQIMARYRPAVNYAQWSDEAPALVQWRWKPNAAGIVFIGMALFFGVMLVQRGQAVFLYFNF